MGKRSALSGFCWFGVNRKVLAKSTARAASAHHKQIGARLVISTAGHARTRRREHLLSATIVVEAINPLFLEYQAAGASFHQTLRTEPWGARTFIVSDPDGNLIAFATSAGS
jgi:uncharacterized glyoxalase superfamily protein PhnB